MGIFDIVILIFGAYMFCSSIYNMIITSNSNGYIVNGVSMIVGGILFYMGIYGKCSGGSSYTPPASAPGNPWAGQGGRRGVRRR